MRADVSAVKGWIWAWGGDEVDVDRLLIVTNRAMDGDGHVCRVQVSTPSVLWTRAETWRRAVSDIAATRHGPSAVFALNGEIFI